MVVEIYQSTNGHISKGVPTVHVRVCVIEGLTL